MVCIKMEQLQLNPLKEGERLFFFISLKPGERDTVLSSLKANFKQVIFLFSGFNSNNFNSTQ